MNIILVFFLCISIIFITIGIMDKDKVTIKKKEKKKKNIVNTIYDEQFNDKLNQYDHIFDTPNVWTNYPFNTYDSNNRKLKFINQLHKERN